MKKIITPAVREEAEYMCDVTGKPAVAKLVLAFNYSGGAHDCKVLRPDLCEKVAAEILNLLQSKYPQFKVQENDGFMVCPFCGRGP